MNNIAVQRLYSQFIEHSECKTPVDVVSSLGALQGQDYPGALWSVGVRLPGSTKADIEQALIDKTIVRTWAMRGTLQLVAAADLRWMLALVAPRQATTYARRYRQLELDGITLERTNTLIADALRDGKPQTKSALIAMLQANGISTDGQRGVFVLNRASNDGLICQSVMQGRDPTFQLIDDSIAQGAPLKGDDAVIELARRYFTTRAPATIHDFVWWSGLRVSDAKMAVDALKSVLVEETIDGKGYWLPADMPSIDSYQPSVHLLPGFDEFLISYRDRSASLDPQHANAIVPGGNGMFISTIVVDGRVAGIWRRDVKKREMVIKLEPFASLTTAQREGAALAAQRYGEFLGMPARLADD